MDRQLTINPRLRLIPIVGIVAAVAVLLLVTTIGQWGRSSPPSPLSFQRIEAPAVVPQALSRPSENPLNDPLPGRPARITIPAINVSASVEQVGVTSAGAMDAPKGPNTVAWYRGSSRPGESGAAVMAGHFGWTHGSPAVFDRLHELAMGNKIYIQDENSTIMTFVVRRIRTYDLQENSGDVFVPANDGVYLHLVTCAGSWSVIKKTYTRRLVVFAEKEVQGDPWASFSTTPR